MIFIMQRVNCFLTTIYVKDGLVYNSRPFSQNKYCLPNNPHSPWLYKFSTDVMIPHEYFSLVAASKVKLLSLTKDDDDNYFDLGHSIITDKLINIRIRQFLTAPICNLNKYITYKGFVAADLEF